jgi:hypothetical protein
MLVLNDEYGLKEEGEKVGRLICHANACFYGAHIFLAFGIIAVVVVAYCTGK